MKAKRSTIPKRLVDNEDITMKTRLITIFVILILAVPACRPQVNPPSRASMTPTPPPSMTFAPSHTPTATSPPSSTSTNAPTSTPTLNQPAQAPFTLRDVNMRDTNNGWMRTDGGQLFRTTDGGQTWTESPGGPCIFSTTDGGLDLVEFQFNGLGTMPGEAIVKFHCVDSTHAWLESSDGGAGNTYIRIHVTRDGGVTWNVVPMMNPLHDEPDLPRGSIHLCAICDDAFYYDPSRVIVVYGDSASMNPGGPVRLRISFDQGMTWETQDLALPQDSADRVVNPGGHAIDRIFFFDQTGFLPIDLVDQNNFLDHKLILYVTHDSGKTWLLLPGVVDGVRPWQGVEFASVSDIFVVCDRSLCASHDGGRSWQKLTSVLDFAPNETWFVQSFDFVDARNGWAVAINYQISEEGFTKLYRTNDGGVTWTPLAARVTNSAPVQVTILTIPPPTPTEISPPRVFLALSAPG